jgi:2-polyprenyl-6-methoxyphenol hydroxylase-like FAD-dependent oxidoreductase
MISAYVLAGELASAGGRHEEAFGKYEAFLRDYIRSKQKGAERFASALAPRTAMGLWFRNRVIAAFAIPGLARVAVGSDIADTIQLRDYHWPVLNEMQG